MLQELCYFLLHKLQNECRKYIREFPVCKNAVGQLPTLASYVRVPDLLLDLQEARDEGRFKDALKKYTNPTLLILDEWLLMRVTEKASANLLELIHKRRKHSSTIFCSQYLEEDWYQKLGGKDNPLTDAIMDRISFDSYKIPIMSYDPEKDISMREVYGLDPSQAQ